MDKLSKNDILPVIRAAIAEDFGDGDHTTLSTIPPEATGKARLIAKEPGVIAGIDVAEAVFNEVNPELKFQAFMADGEKVEKGTEIFEVSGPSGSILSAERLALNFMQRMSGVATATARMVKEIEGTKAVILDTRKTTPNLRLFEKYAVKAGGGVNHRFGLFDLIMIKDNHIDFAGGLKPAVEACQQYLRKHKKDLRIEVEVRTFEELAEVMDVGGVDRVMLDNFTPEDTRKAVEIIDGKYETEASGGITMETVRAYAETGVDSISVGALTHRIRSLDLSLKAV
jgi:nicotinate-nucleotide pyrophosphorylase (carboxylating)